MIPRGFSRRNVLSRMAPVLVMNFLSWRVVPLELCISTRWTHNDDRKWSLPRMHKALSTPLTPSPTTRKAAARAALVGFNDSTHMLLAECFRQYGIEPVPVVADAADRIRREKFEACVVPLADWTGSESILEA